MRYYSITVLFHYTPIVSCFGILKLAGRFIYKFYTKVE
jgi:hypothetical protein